jgi:hypothetical protein
MNYLLSTKFVLDFAAQGKVERPRERCKNGISNLELLARFVEESGGPLADPTSVALVGYLSEALFRRIKS